MLTYELLDTRLLEDEGTISPVTLTGPFPAIIVPTQPIIIQTVNRTWQIRKGQFIFLLHPEQHVTMLPNDNEVFASVYSISFNSYR
ncbi:hypothetical protein C3943_09325 [Lysinibacillus sp. B2A1]|nr:hypothetical protein C3943_09325 [Lysinibacillus sp. B2A1]